MNELLANTVMSLAGLVAVSVLALANVIGEEAVLLMVGMLIPSPVTPAAAALARRRRQLRAGQAPE